jgi:hypothetical protein
LPEGSESNAAEENLQPNLSNQRIKLGSRAERLSKNSNKSKKENSKSGSENNEHIIRPRSQRNKPSDSREARFKLP